MKRLIYILVFIVICGNSYGQRKAYKKADKALHTHNNPIGAAEIIGKAKYNSKYEPLAMEIEAKMLELASNQVSEGKTNAAMQHLNLAKAISLKFRRDSSWTPEQTDVGLNIAYQLKFACEKESDSSSSCYYRSKKIYESILAQDEYNWAANYNLGAMLYHRAVFKIKQLDYETDIFTVERVQDECIKLFFSALPYLKRAYELNPKEEIISKSLSELYLSLNDEKKAAQFKKN